MAKKKSKNVENVCAPVVDEDYKLRDGVDAVMRYESLKQDKKLFGRVRKRISDAARNCSRVSGRK